MIYLKLLYIIKSILHNYIISCVINDITKSQNAYESLFPLEIFLDIVTYQLEFVGCFIVSVMIGGRGEKNF